MTSMRGERWWDVYAYGRVDNIILIGEDELESNPVTISREEYSEAHAKFARVIDPDSNGYVRSDMYDELFGLLMGKFGPPADPFEDFMEAM